MKIALLLLSLSLPLGGCALLAAGVAGAWIENQNHDWCMRQSHWRGRHYINCHVSDWR
jgi:hypothetical protein